MAIGASPLLTARHSLLNAPHRRHQKPTLQNFQQASYSTNSTPSLEQNGFWTRIKEGQWPKSCTKESITAPESFNRWLTVPASFVMQVSIGSVYAWSMWNEPLQRQLGVVVSAADDWTLGQVLPVWSTAAVTLGVCTFLLGPWAEKAGPRIVGLAAASAYGLGCIVSGIGCYLHQLPLVYLGYGVLGGIGWGLGYISPVSTLMRWFPDRRGLATGLALTAFGAGAAVAAPIIRFLSHMHFAPPTFVGALDSVKLLTQGGRQFAEVGGQLREVVVATAADVLHMPQTVSEGVYLVGTGSTGATAAFVTLGVSYFIAMSIGALGARLPHPKWRPAGYVPPDPNAAPTKDMITAKYIDHREALRTPQFYLLWCAVMGNAVAGTAVISSAKVMMGEIFGSALPAIVTGVFTSSYVAALSLANSGGRFGWAVLSDYIGRKQTYFLFALVLPICAGLPQLTNWISSEPSVIPLALFYGGTLLSFSFYGGIFSVLPAYIADIFGQKHVGAIHGRLLTAWSAAALIGPRLLSSLRDHSRLDAISSLAAKCSPQDFQRTFGAPLSDLDSLIAANTVTINRLLEICPPGTIDPTPFLYNTTMYTCSAIVGAALVCNWAMRPIEPAKMKVDAPNTNTVQPPEIAAKEGSSEMKSNEMKSS